MGRKASLLGVELTVARLIGVSLGVAFLLALVMNLWSETELIDHEIDITYDIHEDEFRRTMSGLMRSALLDGNRITTLRNGESLTSMLSAIRSARRSITFETYIFWSGEVSADFVEAFVERARAGVPVHLILDWLGSTDLETEAVERMRAAGVSLVRYRPPAWYTLDKLNNRTHRKILVVDGEIGFTGGVGIADHWLGDAESAECWRDTHFRIEGPAVAQLQAVFMENWSKSHPAVLHGERYFPALESRGGAVAHVMKSSANEESESIRLSYLLSIAASRERVLIANPYFLPDALLIESLIDARRREVDVQVIVPGPMTDVPAARQASRGSWGPLLEAGVAIYEYEGTMFHPKVMVVDDAWVVAGSSNFDERSFLHNDEANLNVWDRDFAAEQASDFEEDKKRSRRVTLEEWKRRPLGERIGEWIANLFRAQL